MKKNILFTVCLMAVATTASAQFKIHSNGNMSFMRSASGNPYSPISLKNGGTSDEAPFFISYSGPKSGIISMTSNAQALEDEISGYGGLFSCSSSNTETAVGLKGHSGGGSASYSDTNPGSIGLWGSCQTIDVIERYGYGVLGSAYGTYNSVGVCGIAAGSSATAAIPDGKYAGLFVGRTKVVGNLDVVGAVNTTLLSNSPSAHNATELRSTDGESFTDMMKGLTADHYPFPAGRQRT